MKGTIELNGMQFHACHGVLPSERENGNDFVVDFSCTYNFAKAMKTDDLADTIDYGAVYDIIAREMQQPSNLLEHVAGRIAASLKEAFPGMRHFKIKVTKNNPPVNGQAASSSVTIEE
ncbi:MAG: dihydroneopterin aldolase [Bacteroidia bacterium]|nr:dihydroneopterin aldolase [Bacteroidia bacterium]